MLLRPILAAILLVLLAVSSTAWADEQLPDKEGTVLLEAGLWLEHVAAPPLEGQSDGPLITLLRVDLDRFELRLHTAARAGVRLRHDEWVDEYGLTAAINAAMFLPNGRSTAFMVDGEHRNNGLDHPSYGGYFAFGPKYDALPPATFAGSDCEGFSLDQLQANYTTIVQNYRLLGCDAEAIAWKDRRAYSGAAVALDDEGRVVFIHTGRSYRMQEFAEWLGQPDLGLKSAVFVEGGPQAGLAVSAGGRDFRWIGARGLRGRPRGNFRPVPNILGIRRR